MQLIVYANPIVSILISPGKPIGVLFLEELELFAPGLLFIEIENNKELIIQKSKLTEEEINRFIEILKQKITVIPEEDFTNYLDLAERICPDKKDITYFALALHLKCTLWSNEKKLKEQKFVQVYATHDLIELFNLSD